MRDLSEAQKRGLEEVYPGLRRLAWGLSWGGGLVSASGVLLILFGPGEAGAALWAGAVLIGSGVWTILTAGAVRVLLAVERYLRRLAWGHELGAPKTGLAQAIGPAEH